MNYKEVQWLAEFGFAVTPVAPNGKNPILQQWPTERLDLRRIWDIWGAAPDLNVGTVCGSTGWVVVDLDGEANLLGGLANLPATPLMSWSGSGDGLHMFYRWPVGVPVGKQKIRLPWVAAGRTPRGSGADLFGDGSQVVLPPSVHPSGKRYEWVNGLVGLDRKTIPYFDLNWLEVK